MTTIAEVTHVSVEIDGRTEKLCFDTTEVTGRQIKERAGVPSDYDLARREGEKLTLVTNESRISLVDCDRFVALPPGTIS